MTITIKDIILESNELRFARVNARSIQNIKISVRTRSITEVGYVAKFFFVWVRAG